MAQVFINAIFRSKIWHFDDSGLRSPVLQKTFQRKRATSIVERVFRETPFEKCIPMINPVYTAI